MTRLTTIFIFIILSSKVLLAQDDCACCSDYHRQFDFWVGDWMVYDTTGNVVGENTIEKLEGDCIVSEYWRGKAGSTGRSYNYFNKSDSTWNQVWIDNNGNILQLKGNAQPGKMILQSKLQKGQKIDWYFNRITWVKNTDESVTQLWEILDKDEKVLSIAFKGIYRKKEY